jgi:hypothetical protein
MTSKEKAKDLVDNMYNTEHCGIEHFPNKRYCDCTEMNLYQAKQCALIAVDEILLIDCWDMSEEHFVNHIEYWEEVKNEINKL